MDSHWVQDGWRPPSCPERSRRRSGRQPRRPYRTRYRSCSLPLRVLSCLIQVADAEKPCARRSGGMAFSGRKAFEDNAVMIGRQLDKLRETEITSLDSLDCLLRRDPQFGSWSSWLAQDR